MIDKFQTANFKKSSFGFTLIEILISMMIFIVLASIVISVLFIILRAGKKSDLLILLRHNGNAAINQMTKNIRYAESLDDPVSCAPLAPTPVSEITITSLTDKQPTTFACTTGTNPTIASNSASLIDTNIATVSDCYFTCSQESANDPPTINLNFKLNSKNAGSFVESSVSFPFQTSVTMRNY